MAPLEAESLASARSNFNDGAAWRLVFSNVAIAAGNELDCDLWSHPNFVDGLSGS
jgi:hypothetical protein